MANAQNNGRTAKRARVVRLRKRNQDTMRRGNSGNSGTSGASGASGSRGNVGVRRSSGGSSGATSTSKAFANQFATLLANQRKQRTAFTMDPNESRRRFVQSGHHQIIMDMIKTLNGKLTGPQHELALAIIHGDLDAVKGRVSTGIPESYFKVGFDTRGRKLVAFAAHVALKFGMDDDRVKIFDKIVQKSKIGHVTACTTGNRGRCLAHNVAEGATSIDHVNTIRNIIHRRFGNEGKMAWSTMSLRRSKSGHLPTNRGAPAVRQHMAGKSSVGNKLSRLSSAERRNFEEMLNQMLKSKMIH